MPTRYSTHLQRQACAAFAGFTFISAVVYSQSTSVVAPSLAVTQSSQHGQGPLGDYVPCIFDHDESEGLRVPTVGPQEAIGKQAADSLFERSKVALEAAASDAYIAAQDKNKQFFTKTNSEGYLEAVAKAFAENLNPDALALSTEDNALVYIEDAARIALNTANRNYLSSNDANVTSEILSTVISDAALSLQRKVKNELGLNKNNGSFQTPTDVSCSMAILTWHETSDIFGRRVANTYIAIQVNVRNLDQTNEFLIHDIQVAVDTGLDKKGYSRFEAGRDKLLVRDVAQRGQSEDRRNLILHSLEAIGAIAGSSAIAGSRDFTTGVAVFQGAFIPSYASLFPDHTVEQLNHINDLVFSASSNSKVLVPIQGSVPLVTFISAKPIEQLPFAWCGHETTRSLFLHVNKHSCNPGTDGSTTATDQKPIEEGLGSGSVPGDLKYKEWRAAALNILHSRTFVVIGGVHIKELPKDSTKFGGLTCPSISGDALDISQTTNGIVTCKAIGSGLGLVTNVVLRKGTEKIAGKISASKDGQTADLTFDASSLSDAEGIYQLYFTNNTGEIDSGETVQLTAQPLIIDFDKTLDTSKTDPGITLKGKHLDLLTKVSLLRNDGTGAATPGVLPTPIGDPKMVTVTFASANLASDTRYFLHYEVRGFLDKQFDLKTPTISTAKAAAVQSGNAKPSKSNSVKVKTGKQTK